MQKKEGDEFILIQSIPTFNFLIRHHHMNKNVAERNYQIKQTMEVMKFVSIQDECMHVKLERYFSNPDDEGNLEDPCKTRCSFCKNKPLVPPLNRRNLIFVLDALFSKKDTTTENAIDAIFKAREHIWIRYCNEITKDVVHALLIQLLALEIVEYQVQVKDDDRDKMSNIVLKIGWSRVKEESGLIAVPTYACLNRWKGINLNESSYLTLNERHSTVHMQIDSDVVSGDEMKGRKQARGTKRNR